MTTLTPPPPKGASVLSTTESSSPLAAQAAGWKFSRVWAGWFRNLYNVMQPGATKDVVITGTTLHFKNGIFTGSSP